MYEFITKEIKKKYAEFGKKYVATAFTNYNYVLLLYLKFICDKKNVTNYSDVEILSNFLKDNNIKLPIDFFKAGINELLIFLQTSDLNELINEIIPLVEYDIFQEFEQVYVDAKSKTLYFFIRSTAAFSVLSSSSVETVNLYKMIDEIKGNKRNIVEDLTGVNLSEIDTLVIIDNEPAYRYISNSKNIIDRVYELFLGGFNGKIILKTSYSKISIIKKRFILENYLSKVVLNEKSNSKDTVLIFNRDIERKKISIIMLNKELEKDHLKIKQIIDNDKPNKKNLIKVEPITIISNNFRIGFKMYLSENIEEVKTINDIIDENTKIIEDISKLNKVIQEEMDKLISK